MRRPWGVEPHSTGVSLVTVADGNSGIGSMVVMGVVAVAVIGGVVFVMTRKPELNEDKPDAGAPAATTETKPLGNFLNETDYDPQGAFSLDDAKRTIPGDGGFLATIKTSQGDLSCLLYDDNAPITVANFVGLATGARAWKDPKTAKWTHRPAYDGTTFHRVIKGFMVQGGDPKGDGTGEPGYTITDEIWSGAKHDRPGLLCMANRGHNTNGAQFFITDAAAAHLDGNYTIFGSCTPVSVVHAIASVPVQGERPTVPVVIHSVAITRTGGN